MEGEPVECRASPPGWTLRLRSGQACATPVPPTKYGCPLLKCFLPADSKTFTIGT